MAFKMMGKKKGMTQTFDPAGNVVVCTVIHVEPNIVTQIKRKESDGYNALQLGHEKIKVKDPRTLEKRLSKQLAGHYKKGSIEPRKNLCEARMEDVESFTVGQEIDLSLYSEISHIDVTAISKGKGFQGAIKRHNYSGGPGAHGSGFHRHTGSCGMRSTPGRTLPGKKKAGRMGGEVVSTQNLRVVGIDAEKNLLIVEGAVPGPQEGLVYFAPAEKKMKKKAK